MKLRCEQVGAQDNQACNPSWETHKTELDLMPILAGRQLYRLTVAGVQVCKLHDKHGLLGRHVRADVDYKAMSST